MQLTSLTIAGTFLSRRYDDPTIYLLVHFVRSRAQEVTEVPSNSLTLPSGWYLTPFEGK